jgi:hypothetical protein
MWKIHILQEISPSFKDIIQKLKILVPKNKFLKVSCSILKFQEKRKKSKPFLEFGPLILESLFSQSEVLLNFSSSLISNFLKS